MRCHFIERGKEIAVPCNLDNETFDLFPRNLEGNTHKISSAYYYRSYKQVYLDVKYQTLPQIPSTHTLKIYCIMHIK